jgi:signal peptidase II
VNRKGLFWGITLAVIALDRVAKLLAPKLPAEGITLIPGVIGLQYAENRGIAFSLLSGHPRLLGILSLVLIIAGFIWLRKKPMGTFPLTGLALMAGGAAGNMFDRLISGYVPDMIVALFVHFPIFNIADSCLTVGCIMLIISLLARPGDWAEAAERKET